ncbi:MAG: hypothetical protein B7Z83_01915 [Thiomonas sp. 20-64-5]|nr:MAG: hypothetical protein B7Z83_01915 [Thiomonas sp. 20-64-5]
MKRTPQRSLLLLWLAAVAWGGSLAALVWAAPSQPGLLLTVWVAGAALLVVLALYHGLSFRLDLLQVQQALREADAEESAAAKCKASLAAIWWPLIDAAAARQSKPRSSNAVETAHGTAQLRAQIEALQAALAAEREQGHVWQQREAQAQAELDLLRRQVQDAAQALAPMESILAAALSLPQMPPDLGNTDAQKSLAQREQLDALAAELSRRATAFDAQARAARQVHAAAALRQHAGQLTRTADDLQLLGLNLRLQLAHLNGVPCAESAVIAQTEADLDALLGGARQLNEAAQVLHGADDLPTDAQQPEPNGHPSAQQLEQIQEVTGAIIATAQSLAAQRDGAASERTQWRAAQQQQTRQLEVLRQQLQRLHLVLQHTARKIP